MIVYGMYACPHCVAAKEILQEKNISYIYKEITESTGTLKQFLKLRDTKDEFVEIKAAGKIGVPCFIMDDKSILFDLEKALEKAEQI